MTAPLVSVLTPSFNQARFLGDCLQSVANQTHRPIEHIVCDGGSTDGSVALLERAGPHVRWVSEPDGGQSDALNKAVAMASGDVIGWVNSDDGYADRRAVASAVALFERHPDVDVVMGHTVLVNESNEVLQLQPALPMSRSLLRVNNYVVQPGVFLRRRCLGGDGLVRPELRFVMDRDLWFRLLGTARFRRLPSVLAYDRHQRARKVEQREFPEELRRFDAELGIVPSRRRAAAAVGVRLVLRAAGLPAMVALRGRLDPAVPLGIGPLAQRCGRQLVRRRAAMGY